MKIYTKTGDRGETGLLGGLRVAKDHPVIWVCGELDETNCALGTARSLGLTPDLDQAVEKIQQQLFQLGARVAGWRSSQTVQLEEAIADQERLIDLLEQELPPLDAFILPGGSPQGASLHLARAVCRRAERRLVALRQTSDSPDELAVELVYLNRLSDLLFVMARVENHRRQQPETRWLGR
ncbi:MAG: cob(I)yrinic acid a,c-diamide adenosyltransferase [Planctomycetota bacterium]|jgi:cob(I)alamin adenosyltransferase